MRTMRQLTRSTFRLAAGLAPALGRGSGRLVASSTLGGSLVPRSSPARRGAELVDGAWRGSDHVGPAYVELENKVRAFHLFETVASVLELDEAPLEPARAIADAERRLGHEPSVWATEGIGYELFDRRHEAGRSTQGLLDGPEDGVPRGSFTTLHTGMGMALGDHSLERLADLRGPSLRPALEDYVETCRAAARPGYEEMAFEPLGLVARLLDASLVEDLARALDGIAGPWYELFWHGVGRGLYFLPANAKPTRSAPWAGLESSRREPPDRARPLERRGRVLVGADPREPASPGGRRALSRSPCGPGAAGRSRGRGRRLRAPALARGERGRGGAARLRRPHAGSRAALSLGRRPCASPSRRGCGGSAAQGTREPRRSPGSSATAAPSPAGRLERQRLAQRRQRGLGRLAPRSTSSRERSKSVQVKSDSSGWIVTSAEMIL